MAELGSDKIRRLQRHLIPVNLLTCVISLVAAITLFFMPLLKIDFGKMITDETVSMVRPVIEKQFAGNLDDAGSGDIDLKELAVNLTDSVMHSIKGEISITIKDFTMLTFSEDPGQKIKEQYFTGEGSIVEELLSGIDTGIKAAIEQTVIDNLTLSLVSNLTDEQAAKLDKEALNTAFRELGNAKDRTEAEAATDNYIDKLKAQDGMELSEADEQTIRDKMLSSYDKAVAETEARGTEYNMEALVCVAVSDSMNTSSSGGEGGDGGLQVQADEPENPADPEAPAESEKKIYTNYDELMGSMSGQEDFNMKTSITNMLEGMTGDISEKITQNKMIVYIVFGAMMFFVGVWLLLFLFAFLHMFARNKRFMMWYVKLFGGIPCIIFWLLPFLITGALSEMIASIVPAEILTMILPIFSAISSATYISGICYLLLWVISIFWAFPIKHKIRKLKKEYDY